MRAYQFTTEDEDYRIAHRAPMHDSGSPLYDVTGTYPDDIYGPKAIQYYGTREPWDSRSIRVIQLSRNKPNQTIQIFRAVPKEVKSNTINPGDWVTASKEYAAQHGRGLGKYKVLTKIVPAKTLFTNGDSIHEWGYDPGGAAVNESLSSLISQDQSERNAYSQFVKSQAGGDWTKGAAMYAKVKKRPSNDIFGEKERLNQFMKMKFDFSKFTNDEWDNYWLLAQHCDFNRNFQQQVLAIIKKYQGVDNSHYHYLADRISCGTNGTQKYGTQDICTIDTQPVAEGSIDNNPIAQKIFFARSKLAPKGYSYDHVGFITQDGKQIQMSGHKGNEVYVTNAVTDDPEFPKQTIKIVSLSKPVSVPTTNTVGAENCGTFVANVLQANGIKGIDLQKLYSVFKPGYQHTQPVAEDKMISNGQPVENITVYHGGKQPITKFNIPPYGVFFTPHKDWAEQYGTVVTAAKIQSPNVYIVSSDGKGFDNEVLDALFRRDYASLTKIIKLLMSRGYTALQTQTDTEMLCVFPGTNIQIVDSSDDPVAVM